LLERTRLLRRQLYEITDDKKLPLDQLYDQYKYIQSEFNYLYQAGDSSSVQQFRSKLQSEYNETETRMMKDINNGLGSSSFVYPLENDLEILTNKLKIIQDDIRKVSTFIATSATQKIIRDLRTKEHEIIKLNQGIRSKARMAALQKEKDEILKKRKLTVWENISLFIREQNIRHQGLLIVGAILLLCGLFYFPTTLSRSTLQSGTIGITTQDVSGLQTMAFRTAVAEINQTKTAKPIIELPKITSTFASTSTPMPILGVIIQDMANMRSSPNLTAPVVKVLRLNSKVTAFANSQDGNWNLVFTENNERGWMHKQLIQFTKSTEMLPVSSEIFPTPVPFVPPTATFIPSISLEMIYDNFKNETTLQFQQYTQSIIGKPVREIVNIGDVDKQGRVSLQGPWSPALINVSDFCITVTGMPTGESLKLSPGQKYALEATVSEIVGNYNYYINCENTLVLNFVR
jgi:hypothetical protein